MRASLQRLGCAVAVGLLLSGCATHSKRGQAEQAAAAHRQQTEEAAQINLDSAADRAAKRRLADHDARLRRLQAELAARTDADSLAASALLQREVSGAVGPSALDLASRAVAAAPGRADLALLHLQLCESAPGCDAAPLERHLAQLDPDNGMPWIYALAHAAQANANAPWRAARAHLAASQRITSYWTATVTHLTAAAAGRQGFDAVAAMIELTGAENTLTAPLQPVARACSLEDVQQSEVLGQCRAIAAAFLKADTVLFEAYGSTLALRLWPPGSEQSQAIVRQRRALRYRSEQMLRLHEKFNSPAATRALAGFVQHAASEQMALKALFADLGVPPEPPASWVDDTPGG